MSDLRGLSDDELSRRLREAASAWFNNEQLLMLEELVRRADARNAELIRRATGRSEMYW
jgi:hypothetical protein